MTTFKEMKNFFDPEFLAGAFQNQKFRKGIFMMIIGIVGYILLFVYLPWQGALGVVMISMVVRHDHEVTKHNVDE